MGGYKGRGRGRREESTPLIQRSAPQNEIGGERKWTYGMKIR